ncbi:transposase [Halorubrum sp. AD140]|uniref:transposase n=1 Tax=Halorubrum sp. AD140 TaxID=3050073 RepID=UPI002ACCB01E|nr:transposase [Halorubrum sp. AD140]MDZ5811533.1 transposase [Halorubrum sp. AD140]
MTDSSEPYLNRLAKQAEEIIDEDTDWVAFARQFDAERYQYGDSFPEWHSSTPFVLMFLAFLWALVEGQSLTGIPDRLEEKPELALAFGFDPDDLPSKSTFKPSRLQERFDDLNRTILLGAEGIREIAAERGSPIGNRLTQSLDDDREGDELSERTIERLLRKKGKEVLKELKSVAIPSMDLPRPDGGVYGEDELLLLAAVAAIKGLAANGGGKVLGDLMNPDPEPFLDPFTADGPTGETLLESVKEMSVDQIATVMNFALRKTYTRAKPRLRELENESTGRFGVRANVAIDITYVAYYGELDEMEWLQGAPDDKEYTWCHKFATICIVGENTHFVLGVCPLGNVEYAENDAYPGAEQTFRHGNVVRRLLSIADQYASIRTVYADRAFHAADVIHALESRDLKYVIPAKKDDKIERMCDRFDHLKRGYDEEHDTPLYVKNGSTMYGPVKGKVTNERVTTNVVVLPPDEDDETHKRDSPQPFLTNLDVSDEIALDRRWAREKIEQYSDRGGIERSYSSIKECAAWTTSKEFEVRWFHFGFACVVYNMWLLVDFLTQDRIGVIEVRKKPRISLSRFLDWLDKELVTLL